MQPQSQGTGRVPPAAPMQPPMMMMGPPPWPAASRRPGNGLLLGLVVLASVLMLAGLVVLASRGLIDRPGYSSYYQNPGPDYVAWLHTMRILGFTGGVLLSAGVLVALMVGFVGAIFRPDLPEGVRRAMVIGPTALLIAWMIVFLIFGYYVIQNP